MLAFLKEECKMNPDSTDIKGGNALH